MVINSSIIPCSYILNISILITFVYAYDDDDDYDDYCYYYVLWIALL